MDDGIDLPAALSEHSNLLNGANVARVVMIVIARDVSDVWEDS